MGNISFENEQNSRALKEFYMREKSKTDPSGGLEKVYIYSILASFLELFLKGRINTFNALSNFLWGAKQRQIFVFFVGFEIRKRSKFVRFCKIFVNFESAKNFLFWWVFGFFLQGTVEQAEICIIFFFLNFLEFFFEVENLRQKSIFRILRQQIRSKFLWFSGIFWVLERE